MKSILAEKSAELSLRIISYYKWITVEHKEFVMSKQLLRSGTSIGANVHEANYAVSLADFINKMQIAVKEAAESEYWIYLLDKSDYFTQEYSDIKQLLDEVKRMLVSSLNTAKKSQK